MSMILDAMKRSKDGETRTSDIPTVDTVHYVPEPETRFSPWQMGWMLAGVVVIVAVGLTAMWSSEPELRVSGTSEFHSAAPPITSSSDAVKTPVSASRGTDQPAERPAVRQLKADESKTAAVPPSYVRDQPLSEAAATQTSVLKTSQDVTPMAAPVSVPAQREGPVVTKSTPPSGRVMPQATQPVTSPDELQAIYQALNEEANQTAVTDESSASSDGGESGADNSVSPTS